MVQEIASSFSEELSPGFFKEVLEEISSAAHVTTFADNSIHLLHKNINVVTMPTRDVSLRHFRKT